MTSRIDRLFGSKTRVALLSKLVINPDRSYYIRELSKELDIPYSMLYKEEKKLACLGIVNEEKKGKVTLMSINRKLPYFRELKGLLAKTTGFADLARTALSGLGAVKYALVYGSLASGEESESSDVDIMIVGDLEEKKALTAAARIEQRTGREVNYILWSEQEFRSRVKSKHHLVADIVRRPVIMLIGEESEFRTACKK